MKEEKIKSCKDCTQSNYCTYDICVERFDNDLCNIESCDLILNGKLINLPNFCKKGNELPVWCLNKRKSLYE